MLTVSQKTKTYIIELLNDFIEFRIIIIKSYLKESNSFIQDLIQDFIQNLIQSKNFVQSLKDNTSRRNLSRPRQRLIRFQNNMTDIIIYMFRFMPPLTKFQTFRLKEFNELLEKEIFEIIYIDDLFIRARVFESRFINQVKNEGIEKAFEKSRFVIQAFNDSEK